MAGISVATLGSIFTSIENSIKTSLPSFAGFGGTIEQDIGSAVVDAETLGGAVLAAFTAAGNPEAAVVAPVVSIAEAAIAGHKFVIKLANGADGPDAVKLIHTGEQLSLAAHTAHKSAQKAHFIEPIGSLVEGIGAGGQVDGRADGGYGDER